MALLRSYSSVNVSSGCGKDGSGGRLDENIFLGTVLRCGCGVFIPSDFLDPIAPPDLDSCVRLDPELLEAGGVCTAIECDIRSQY